MFVTGKGGVGKTTVAAALGLAAAKAGKRTIVCEVAEQERISRAFRHSGVGHEEVELRSNLAAISLDPDRSLEQWLHYQLKSRALAGMLGSMGIFNYLTAAAPGVREMVTVGKIWELAQLERRAAGASPYDLVVVDSPATGHGLALLGAPKTFSNVARVGPISRQAEQIHAFLADESRTGIVAVALPEEMPVNETLDFSGRLREQMGRGLDHVVVNGVYPERFSAAEAERIAAVDGRVQGAAAAAVSAALSVYSRARAQRTELRRLRDAAEAPVGTLPYLFEPELGPEQLEGLAQELERTVLEQ